MSTEVDFFADLKEWSERKLTLLSKYLDASSRILKELYYIDGFAGRGYYGTPGDQAVPGSPIRAAQLARTIRDEKRAYSLHCINIESNKVNYDQLVEATQPYKDFTTNLYGPFGDQVDRLLRIVGNKPVLCFLDPFGIDGMDMSAIARLTQRPGAATDLLVRFDVGEARRRDGYFDSAEISAPKQYDILCRVYGVPNKEQLHNALAGADVVERHRTALKYYMRRLREQYLKPDHALVGAYHVRSIEGESKYWMVAATGHAKGFVLTSDIIFSTEENYKAEVEWYRQNTSIQPSMLPDMEPTTDQIEQEKVRQLEELIFDRCRGRSATRLTIHASILRNGWFGNITRKHVNAALKSLTKQGKASANSTRLSDDDTVFTFI